MGQAFQNENASTVVDNYPAGNIDLSNADPESVNTFYVGNAEAYGVNTSVYTASIVTAIGGGIASSANCKIRAEVNGSLALEKTYTAAEVNPSFSFPVAANALVTITCTTNAAGLEVVKLAAFRLVIKAGVAA